MSIGSILKNKALGLSGDESSVFKKVDYMNSDIISTKGSEMKHKHFAAGMKIKNGHSPHSSMKMPIMNMQSRMPTGKIPKLSLYNKVMKKANVMDKLRMSNISIDKKMKRGNNKISEYVSVGSGMEGNALQHIVHRPDMTGLNRIRMQGKLDMFGDHDRDGVANILDCNPMDRKKQGTMDNDPDFGYTEKDYPTAYKAQLDYEQPLEIYDVEPVKKQKPFIGPLPDTRTFTEKTRDAFEQGMSNIRQTAGQAVEDWQLKQKGEEIGQTLGKKLNPYEYHVRAIEREEQKIAHQKKMNETAQEFRQALIARMLEKKELDKIFNPKPKKSDYKQMIGAFQQGVRPIGTADPNFYARLQNASFKNILSQRQMVADEVGNVPYDQKVLALLKAPQQQRTLNEAFQQVKQLQSGVQPIPRPQPVYMPTTMMPTTPTPARQVAPEGQTIISPYSKRPVRYTRGPYRKRQEPQPTMQ